jgi:hypothetical protein
VGAAPAEGRGLTLVLRPVGRGNWKPLVLAIESERVLPLLVRVGDRLPLGGVTYRISKVLP